MSTAPITSSARPATTWARYGLVAVAWLFALGGVIQLFLVGLAVFDPDPSGFEDHVDFGRMIGFLTYLLPILALIGRVGVRLVGHALVVTILYIVQSILANLDDGSIAALHAVNGFFLIGAAGSLGGAVLGRIRSSTRATVESSR